MSESLKRAQLKYREKNREKFREYSRLYYEANRERIIERIKTSPKYQLKFGK